jgi:outer membrane protein assembly factor BamB
VWIFTCNENFPEEQDMVIRKRLIKELAAFLGIIMLGCLSQPANAASTPGTLKWTFNTTLGLSTCPAIGSDGTIYVAAGSGQAGNLYAVKTDGTVIWSDPMCVYMSSPAIGSNGTIYVGARTSANDSSGTLYAMNPDGSKKWTFKTGGQIDTTPAIGKDGTIYVGSEDGYIYAVDSNGKGKWKVHEGGSTGAIVGRDGTIYVYALQGGFVAVNSDGSAKWATNLQLNDTYPAIGSDGTIYVSSISAINAVNPTGGSIQWSLPGYFDSPAIGHDGTIYACGSLSKGVQRYLYAFSPTDGHIRWDTSINTTGLIPSTTPPAVGSDGTIYVGLGLSLCAISPSGAAQWVFIPSGGGGGFSYSAPTIAGDGTIYVAGDNQTLYAIYSGSQGLAKSSWPMYMHDIRLTGTATPVAPGKPTGVSATGGDKQATVTFTIPASNGGSAIKSYTAKSNPGGKVASVAAPSTSITVTGLKNGTAYTFTVTATNAIGTGPASDKSNSVTPAGPDIPGAPTAVSATAGNAQATVKFTLPTNTVLPITSCTVTSKPGGITKTGSGSPITVSGLSNGTAYTFTVTATDSLGTGPASKPSKKVTPATVPGAPTGVSATAGNAQAKVSFTAPGSNGGNAITGYQVTSSPDAAHPNGVTANGTRSPITVKKLTNGTPYTFTVTAKNKIGAGPASAASSAVTPGTKPNAPTITGVTPDVGQATVTFTEKSTGGSPTTYAVTSKPAGGTDTSAPDSLSHVVTNLTSGKSYRFTVRATNAFGSSSSTSKAVKIK